MLPGGNVQAKVLHRRGGRNRVTSPVRQSSVFKFVCARKTPLHAGFGDSITPVPKFPDRPGMENRVHFSYASSSISSITFFFLPGGHRHLVCIWPGHWRSRSVGSGRVPAPPDGAGERSSTGGIGSPVARGNIRTPGFIRHPVLASMRPRTCVRGNDELESARRIAFLALGPLIPWWSLPKERAKAQLKASHDEL